MSTEFSDLPSEVVRHVLSYLPLRREAALVCKDFYGHICSIEKDYYKLSLNSVSNYLSNFKFQFFLKFRLVQDKIKLIIE